MPAIQPARLKQQTLALAKYINQPDEFSVQLDDLLTFYANRVQRPGQSGKIASLLPSYNAPPPVVRQIVAVLKPLVKTEPEIFYQIITRLWNSGLFEQKAIAAKLLGGFPVEPPEPVVELFNEWAIPKEDGVLLGILFSDGMAEIKAQHPMLLPQIFSEWMTSFQPTNLQILGLRGLISLVNDRSFENLPLVFKLITPFVRDPHVDVRPYVLDVLEKLARRSPQETVFLVQQALRTSGNPSTRWLARQTLANLPPEAQKQLRAAMLM